MTHILLTIYTLTKSNYIYIIVKVSTSFESPNKNHLSIIPNVCGLIRPKTITQNSTINLQNILISTYGNFNCFFFEEENTTAEQIIQSAKFKPINSTRRIVLITYAESIKIKNWPLFESFLKKPIKTTSLIFMFNNHNCSPHSNLSSYLIQHNLFFNFNLDSNQLKSKETKPHQSYTPALIAINRNPQPLKNPYTPPLSLLILDKLLKRKKKMCLVQLNKLLIENNALALLHSLSWHCKFKLETKPIIKLPSTLKDIPYSYKNKPETLSKTIQSKDIVYLLNCLKQAEKESRFNHSHITDAIVKAVLTYFQ